LGWTAFLYGLGVRFRLWCYRQGWYAAIRLPCRVVSVGNLTVGGTGKTPVVILLTEWLLAQGQRVAILSRGYKRSGRSPFVLVSDGRHVLVDSAESGDEPALIAQRCPGAVVAVGADRAALGRWVVEHFPIDCLVLDDGFQHLAVRRDLDLVLLDAMDATGLDALLPAGRLREPLAGLARAGAVLITRADSPAQVDAVRSRIGTVPDAPSTQVEIVFRPEALIPVTGDQRREPDWGRGKSAWLVCGIGNSASFRRSAEAIGLAVLGETVFRDHHAYGPVDVQVVRAIAARLNAALVVTTEKDAVKLAPLLDAGDPWWALRVRAEVVRGEEQLHRLIAGERQAARG
jgi:tetraacyldisaccharide 4'-kinase